MMWFPPSNRIPFHVGSPFTTGNDPGDEEPTKPGSDTEDDGWDSDKDGFTPETCALEPIRCKDCQRRAEATVDGLCGDCYSQRAAVSLGGPGCHPECRDGFCHRLYATGKRAA